MLRSPPFLTNMLHSKLKQFVLHLPILGSQLPCLSSDLLVDILRKSGFALVHLTISNSFALTLTHHSAIIQAKNVFQSLLISSLSTHPHKLWNSINKLLHRKPMPQFASNMNQVLYQLIKPSSVPFSVLLLEKKSASSSRSHPLPSMIWILYLPLF